MSRTAPSGAAPSTGTDVGLVAFLGAAGVGALLWAGGAASALVSGHRVPKGRYLAGFEALGHFGAPSVAWGSPVGPAPLYWALTLVTFTVAAIAGFGALKLWRSLGTGEESDAARAPGTATRKEVRRAAGDRALLARSATLRRSLPRPRPADVGYRLGSARGLSCWASVEDSVLVLGPPRSGKGLHLVVPMVLDAPGAVVTTSTRPDNLALTLAKRSGRGPVMVFDPQGLDGPPAHAPVLHWSLTRGCEAGQVAMARAEALVPSAGSAGVENSNFWRAQALSATRCLLHAAALDGRPPADREERSAATKGRCRTWRSTSGTARSRGRASESGSRWVQFGLPGQRPPAGQRSRAGTRAITSRSRRSRQRART